MELTYEDLWLNWTPRLPAWGVGFPGLHVGPVSVSIGCDPTYRVAYWWPDLSHEERCAIWTQIWPVFRTSIEQQLGIRVLRCECGCGMVQFLSLAQFQQASFVGSAGGAVPSSGAIPASARLAARKLAFTPDTRSVSTMSFTRLSRIIVL